MTAEVVENVETAQPEAKDPYEGRLLGRTKPQKAREREIRDAEREHIIGVFTRLGDGRQNRKAPKEERAAFRKAAAMLAQHQDV